MKLQAIEIISFGVEIKNTSFTEEFQKSKLFAYLTKLLRAASKSKYINKISEFFDLDANVSKQFFLMQIGCSGW